MALKPTEKPDWVSDDDVAKIQEPSVSKKLTGFKKEEKPPFNFLNWIFNIVSHWIDYLAGNAQFNIIIDSDTDEGDYVSMAAYIADSPAAGDRVLIKVDEVLAATLSIPANIELTQAKGNKFTLTANFSPIIEFAAGVTTKGALRVENSNTGTIAKAFSINGNDNHHDNLISVNVSTGTITDSVYIEAGVTGCYAQGRSINSGGGAITNDLTDNSGNDENHVTVKGDNVISRSTGANKFYSPELITTNLGNASAQTLTLTESMSGTPAADTLYPGLIPKVWVNFTWTAGPVTVRDQRNVTGVVRNSMGNYTITFDRDFDQNDYSPSGMLGTLGAASLSIGIVTQAVGSITIETRAGGALFDSSIVSLTIMGNH